MFFNIALVGRPNVGKSRLFNRLAGKKISIVHDQAGVTRDIIQADIGGNIVLLDTGGIGFSGNPENAIINVAVEEQVDFAIRSSDVILFIVDGIAGLTPLDFEIAQMLRSSSKEVVVVVNKIDSQRTQNKMYEFSELGFKNIIGLSAEHGYNASELEEYIKDRTREFRSSVEKKEQEQEKLKICFIGRPNVGKSSTVNALLKEKRLIVSEIPGTTRDAVNVNLQYKASDGETHSFELIDTAGVKTINKLKTSVDFYSIVRTKRSIEDANVIFLILDAVDGVTRMDKKLSGEILEAGKGLVVLVNKWDIAQEQFETQAIVGYDSLDAFKKHFEEAVQKELFAIPGIPVVFVSAKENLQIDSILENAINLHKRMSQNIKTGELNRVIQDALEARQPSIASGKRFKIYYAVQTENFPFRFRLFCNRTERLDQSFKRYLENSLRKSFDIAGCPMHFEWSEKEKRYSGEAEA